MLRILKNYKTSPSDAEKTSNTAPKSTLPVTERAAETTGAPTWLGMSSRLLARLNVADESTPEMQMPTPLAPVPSNRPKG